MQRPDHQGNSAVVTRPDDYGKRNGLLRYSQGDAANGFSATFQAYDGKWSSSDQIPERAVADGEIPRFGNVDPSDGGSSSRYSVATELRRADVPFARVRVAGPTRQNFAVTESATGRQFRFVHEPLPMATDEWTRCVDVLLRRCRILRGLLQHPVNALVDQAVADLRVHVRA